jgi:hypothetical protein
MHTQSDRHNRNPFDFQIPFELSIGVTGQRTLGDEPLIRVSIQSVLRRMDEILKYTPHTFIAVTSLTEGSDRLLADEVLNWAEIGTAKVTGLEIVLPVSADDYIEECATHESKQECVRFVNRAQKITVISSKKTREEECFEIGQSIVQSCDVLVAIWDGKPSLSPGGTSEMVKYARMVGRTLFWIHRETGKIIEERHGDGILESLEYFNSFNGESVREEPLRNRCTYRYGRLAEIAQVWRLNPDVLLPLKTSLLPHFVRVQMLKEQYERRYMWAGSAVYALAAAAVATVTIQTLFFPLYPSILWMEVIEIALILGLIMASRLGDWHRKWIDYRFMAERLRTAMFLSIFCVAVERPALPPHLSLSHPPNDWLNRCFDEILKKRPLEYCILDLPFEQLKQFLLSAWIDEQISYYTKSSTWNARRFMLLSEMTDILFALTLVMATIHALGLEHNYAFLSENLSGIFAACTIILPAIGGALGAIRIKREYLRNSERYAHMVRHLSVIGNQIKRAPDMARLIHVLREANEVTLREQQDWRVVFRFRDLETP